MKPKPKPRKRRTDIDYRYPFGLLNVLCLLGRREPAVWRPKAYPGRKAA